MKCPHCDQELQTVGRFQICPEHGPVAGVAGAPAPGAAAAPAGGAAAPERAQLPESPALERLLESWPAVLALLLQEYLEESQRPVLKLWHACEVVENTLRLLVMVGVAEVAPEGELPEALAEDLARHIERPMLGNWRQMAGAVAAAVAPSRSLVPELRGYVQDTLVPLLDGAVKPRTAESAFGELRNLLAHGAGVTRATARQLLARWQGPLEAALAAGAWLGEVRLVARLPGGGLGELRGPRSRPVPLSPAEASALAGSLPAAGSLFLVRGGRALALWPLGLFGPPRRADGEPTDLGEAPQLYTRRGEVFPEYTPLGLDGAYQAVGDEAALAAFQRVFRARRRPAEGTRGAFAVRGFEEAIRKDAAQLVGRVAEVERLTAALAAGAGGVLWVWGRAGVGKSFVVARVTEALLEAAGPHRLVLAFRFKVGDDRCSREAFLRFASERLAAWSGQALEAAEERGAAPLAHLRSRLERLAGERQVVFVLDGLDELAASDPAFVREVPLALRLARVTWLCAGRPERGLPEAFAAARAEEPFPQGLPRMSAEDIRAMLLTRLGHLSKRLVRGDREEAGRVVNPFIERVAKNADGLPIYVKYVVGDVLEGKVSPEPGAALPPSLADYHEKLLRRCAVGALHQVLTPLAATLAVAREPLSAEELAALLARRRVLSGAQAGLPVVHQALAAIAAMVDLAPDPDGGEGYTLWHQSLREHMLASAEMAEPVLTARATLAEAALAPAGDAATRYLYRQGIAHLLEADQRAAALGLITDLAYLDARLDALPAATGPAGLAEDWKRWLLPSDRLTELEEAAAQFSAPLAALCEAALAAERRSLRRLQGLLLWEVTPRLGVALGGEPAWRVSASELLRLSENLLALDPDNIEYLRDLGRSYDRLGDVEARTDAGKARVWYERSLTIAQRLAALEPENTLYLRDLAESYVSLGGVLTSRDPRHAREWGERGLAIAERLVVLEPENTRYLSNLWLACRNLGNLEERTDTGKARGWHERGLAIVERLVALAPENTGYLGMLSEAYDNLGDLEERTDAGKARVWYERSLTIAQRLAALEPENTLYLSDLRLSYTRLGDLEKPTDPGKARGWYEQGLAIAERLVALAPENTRYLNSLSLSYGRLGNLEERTDAGKARDWYRRRLAIAQRLAAIEPHNPEYARELSVSYSQLGYLLREHPQGRVWCEKALVIEKWLAWTEPDNTQYLHDLSITYEQLGDLDRRTDAGKAWVWYDKALAILKRLTALEPHNVRYWTDLARWYGRRGDFIRPSDPARARGYYEKGLALEESALAQVPDAFSLLRVLAFCDRLSELDGPSDPRRAQTWFARSVAARERLVAAKPGNTEYLHGLAVAYERLSGLDRSTDPVKARGWHEQGLSIRERLVALESENTHYLRGLAAAYERLGDLDERTDPAKARGWYEKGLAIREGLTGLKPECRFYLRDLAMSYNRLGNLDRGTDQVQARGWYKQGLIIHERLVALKSENTCYLRDLAAAYERLGNLDGGVDPMDARVWYEKGLAIREQMVVLRPEVPVRMPALRLNLMRW